MPLPCCGGLQHNSSLNNYEDNNENNNYNHNDHNSNNNHKKVTICSQQVRITVCVCRYVADTCNHTLAAYEVWLRTKVVDFQTGLLYLKRAAHHGYENACLTLGKLLHDGSCVERDISAAVSLFERAALGGSAVGWNSVGVCKEEMGELVDAQRCYR